ncbi:MAG: hypothetical protein DHS20C18_22140 [Saprospiraceae bacterium]|nr:MAG: hypothetical protein DHS20C18_22140 [Saprospiraceae bacterium]
MRTFTLLLALIALSIQLPAQTVYWSEDFGDGQGEWTINTSLCGDFTDAPIGTYQFMDGTYNGAAISGVEGSISFNTNTEYTARLTSATDTALVQARYTWDENTGSLTSNLSSETLTLGSSDYSNTGNTTNWISNLHVTQTTLDEWGRTALGLDSPTLTIAGSTATITSQDGLTVLNYERTSSCGEIWLWSHNGFVGNGLAAAPTARIMSPTASNGSMFINGDFYITNGTNNPTQPYPTYVSELISPMIDLTDVQDPVSFEYSQLVRVLNPAAGAPQDEALNPLRTSISFSTDGGNTWSVPTNANEGLNPNDNQVNNRRSFPAQGLQGQDSVRIKFTYAMDFYFWVLDDISIVSRPNYEMQVNRNFFAVAPNAITPISQVEPMYFLADIQNNGGRTTSGVALNLTITNDDTNEVIYDDTNVYGDLTSDSLAENVLFDSALDPANLIIGSYTGLYEVSLDSTDSDPSNNSIEWAFQVSETVFSKDFGMTRNITPGSDNSFIYGNCYYVPNGEGFYARHLTFGATTSTGVPLAGKFLSTFLYKWDGDVNEDGQANITEYGSPIAFNSYLFEASDDDDEVTIPVDLDGQGIALEDDSYYLVMLQYQDVDDENLFLLASDAIDYAAMSFATDSLDAPRYGSLLAVGEETDFSTVGFGRELVPVANLLIGNNPDLSGPAIVSTREPLLIDNVADIYPNPADENFKVDIQLPEVSNNVSVSLMSVDGKHIARQDLGTLQTGQANFNVSQLPAGKYLVKIKTEKGINVQPIVVTH